MDILQTPLFKRQTKKLHRNQKKDLDMAIREIIANLSLGDFKKGALSSIQVYKFKMVSQLTLLAYEVYESQLRLELIALGSHENFYRDLKLL